MSVPGRVDLGVLGSAGAEPVALANFIDGAFVAPAGGAYVFDIDPATGREVARVPRSSSADVDAAAAAAVAAFPAWSKTAVAARAALLDRIADLIDLHKEGELAEGGRARTTFLRKAPPVWLPSTELATMEAEDVGKTIVSQ